MRTEGSQGRVLLDRLIDRLTVNTAADIKSRDLAEGVPIINETWINANFTDATERTQEQRSVLSYSDALVEELRQADILAAALPIYNFGVPAAFKAWIDLVARARLTFKYTENGPVGLLENKKAYIVITSGGTKLHSEIDFVTPWLRHVLGFIGIDDVTIIDASGLNKDAANVIHSAQGIIDSL